MGQSFSQVEACKQLDNELGIKKPFLLQDIGDDSLQRIVCLVQQEWLSIQIGSNNVSPQDKLISDFLLPEEQTTLLQPSPKHELNGWQRVIATVLKKPLKKIKIEGEDVPDMETCSIFDFLHCISTQDHKNINVGIHERFSAMEKDKSSRVKYLTEDVFSSMVKAIYGFEMKGISKSKTPTAEMSNQFDGDLCNSKSQQPTMKTPLHFVPLLLACQSKDFIFLIESTPCFSLHDVLAFSPAIASNSAAKFMFLLYQILKIFSLFQEKGFSVSPLLNFQDLYVTNSLWLSISPFLVDGSNIVEEEKNTQHPIVDHWSIDIPEVLSPPFSLRENLHDYTTMWVNCELTTFDYILILNTLAGRRMKDPSHYPIFPWVMDFTKQDGGFRDLAKSKYRLCKSDAQLDITFNQPDNGDAKRDTPGHVPHHISDDPLTAISYYVYLARCVPKDVLCANVRPRWVPDEYPSSLERLYSWTPEECIPEFYSDPSIFKSIHTDLPDLILPAWAKNGEDFIKHHRSVLEGHYVSFHLNHWIDIVFGYKLSGLASVDSKNVYLSLVDGHSHLTNYGVLQLFSRPHPVRKVQNLAKDPTADASSVLCDLKDELDSISADVFTESNTAGQSNDSNVTCISGKLLEEDVKSTSHPAFRRDMWSIDSAIDEASQIEEPKKVEEQGTELRQKPSVTLLPSGLRMKIDTLLEGGGNEAKTPTSSEFKVVIDGCGDFINGLEAVEKELKFNCHIAPGGKDGIGTYKFGSVFDNNHKGKEHENINSATARPSHNNNIMLLANLLIELALHDYVRLRGKKLSVEERLNENVRLMKVNLHRFPSWLLSILENWLESSGSQTKDDGEREGIMAKFFKTPSLLLNRFLNPFPCPDYFTSLHVLLSTLFSGSDTINEPPSNRTTLNVIPTGNALPSAGNIIRAAYLIPLLIEELDAEGIELLLAFLLPLFSSPFTKLHAFLHLFPSLGNVMGLRNSMKYFYDELQRLYDSGAESDLNRSKLLDHSFISKVITVFGLHCFLDCFMHFVIDGLVEKSDAGFYKKKNEIESFYFDNTGEESEKSSKDLDKKITTEEDNIENVKADSNDEKINKARPEDFANRKSSILEDDDNVNVFDPKSVPGKRLAGSGVFTRLESILENGVSKDDNEEIEEEPVGYNSVNDSIFKKDEGIRTFSSDDFQNITTTPEQAYNKSVFSIVEKSEVIYHESDDSSENRFYEGDSLSDSDEENNSNFSVSEKEESLLPSSTQVEKECMVARKTQLDKIASTDSQNSDSSFAVISDGVINSRTERCSTLSESIAASQLLTSNANDVFLPHGSVGDNSFEMQDTGSIEDDLITGIEDFSIDSMYSEDDGKSFLIRRSSIKTTRNSGNSPFMVLPSEEDVNNGHKEDSLEELNDDSYEEYSEVPARKISDAVSLEEISKIPGTGVAVSVKQCTRTEELSLASLKWIVPWLGPSLTTKYVVNPILKKIPKIWISIKKFELTTDDLISTAKSKGKFLTDCLVDVARIYGNAIVLHLFIPYGTLSVNSALRSNKVSAYVEGQLVSALEILSKTLITLKADTLAFKMEALSHEIFEPLLRLLSSFKQFNSGYQIRSVLLHSLVDLLAALCQNLGQIDAREAMTPLLQRFFSCFDCVYRLEGKSGSCRVIIRKYSFINDDYEEEMADDLTGDSLLDETIEAECGWEENSEVSSNTNNTGQPTLFPSHAEHKGDETIENIELKCPEENKLVGGEKKPSPDAPRQQTKSGASNKRESREKENKEKSFYKDLYSSFTPALAHYSYVLFCRVLGDHFVGSILYNEELIWQLCSNFDESLTITSNNEAFLNDLADIGKGKDIEKGKDASSFYGKNLSRKRTVSEHEEEEPVYRSTWQHIEGEWLTEWKERLDMKTDDRLLRFKGKRLQTYAGHSSAVRDIYIPDNEHYFLSASRDKTVKFWLLKNHGNGTAQIGCMKTYDKHSKSVFAVQSIESKRFAVSCDGTVHIWDPIKSATVSHIDLGKNSAVTSIRTLPVPNISVALATTEGTIRLYDVRQKSLANEWKLVSSSAAGNVRCLCVNESGTWIAAGFSSGFISFLDLRTGILRGQWKAHESEILQIEPYSDHNFLSSSNDLRMKMWNEDGSLALKFKQLCYCKHIPKLAVSFGFLFDDHANMMISVLDFTPSRPLDPVNCVTFCNDQCVWASSSGNRIGITHHIENGADYESCKIPPELFRGTISKLKVLPVNQLYLVGSENGNVVMFA